MEAVASIGMDLPIFQPTAPALSASGSGSWDLTWDRTREVKFVESCWNDNELSNKSIIIRNIDQINQKTITDGIRSIGGRDLVEWFNISSSNDFWQALIASYITQKGKLPSKLGLSYIKHARNILNSKRTIEGAIRRLSNVSTEMYLANKKVTFEEILRAANIEIDIEPALLNSQILSIAGEGEPSFTAAIAEDFKNDKVFNEFILRNNFVMRGSYHSADTTLGQFILPGMHMVFLQETKLFPSEAHLSISGNVILSAAVLGVVDAIDLIEPVWKEKRSDPKSKAFVSLILEEHSRNISASPASALLMGESALKGMVDNIKEAIEKSSDIDSILPKQSPLDAEVQNDRIILRGSEGVATSISLDALNDFREQYLSEAQRLVISLQGTNAVGGFLSRLESAKKSLSAPLSYSTSIMLGDQARALEVMFPAVSDVLTEISAADVGAFVTGFGLLVRQFPAWREFVNEARDKELISESDESALTQVIGIFDSAPDSVVDPLLNQALANTAEIRDGLEDKILDFGLLRAVGNIVRAVGRWLLERARGVAGEVNKEIDKSIAKALKESALGALIVTASEPLFHLASSQTIEFGWLIGLGFLLRSLK